MGSRQDNTHAVPLIDPAAADEGGAGHEEAQEQQQQEQKRKQPSQPPSLWGAVACLVLFSFTGIAESTVRLLNCVSVEGKRVLYYAGAVQCRSEWQWAVLLLLTSLLVGPLYTLLLYQSEHHPFLSRLPRPSMALLRKPMLRAFRQHATEPFKGESWQWTAVLMLQRLLTVMCQSLSTEPVVSSLLVTIISFVFTLLQLHARPYCESHVNDLQLLALVCLTMLSVLNSAQSAFESAGVDAEQYASLAALLRYADWVMFLLLLPPPALLLYNTALNFRCNISELVAADGEPRLEEEENEDVRQRHEQEKAEIEQEKAEIEQQLAEERETHKQEKAELLESKDAEHENLMEQEHQRWEQEHQRWELEKLQLQQEKLRLEQELDVATVATALTPTSYVANSTNHRPHFTTFDPHLDSSDASSNM
jgi:hypothetical protein